MESGMEILEEVENNVFDWNIELAKHSNLYHELGIQSEYLEKVIESIENYQLRLLDYELEGKEITLAKSRMDIYMDELKTIYKVEF